MLFCKTPAFATVFLLKGFLLYLEGFRRFRTENSGVAQKLKKAHGRNVSALPSQLPVSAQSA